MKKATSTKKENKTKEITLFELFRSVEDINELIPTFKEEIQKMITSSNISDAYNILFLFDNTNSINNFVADSIYKSVNELTNKDSNLLLILSSNGGSIEPAYLISKCLKKNSKKFSITIPRIAKSAATLLSLGADELHMGGMSQLGPIDPQVGGLPALALGNALENLAELSEKYPKSSRMFAIYLSKKLNLQVLGYFQRVSESAVQYAERLLSNKELPSGQTSLKVAKSLVYSYKDHGFVIDHVEASQYLGDMIKTDTSEYELSERIYNYLFEVDLLARMLKGKTLSIIGSLESGIYFFNLKTGNDS